MLIKVKACNVFCSCFATNDVVEINWLNDQLVVPSKTQKKRKSDNMKILWLKIEAENALKPWVHVDLPLGA